VSVTSALLRNRDTVEEPWNWRVLRGAIEDAARTSTGEFLEELKSFFRPTQMMLPMVSGTAALQKFLSVTRADRTVRRQVLICSFNCPTVCDAVTGAGLEPETFDFAHRSGRIDWESLGRHLQDKHHAVVVPHLFGVPTDFRPLLAHAERRGVLVIEDCAHAVGATIGGVPAGSIGHAAILSFSYDKPISLGGGGALLLNNKKLSLQFSGTDARCPTRAEEGNELKLFVAWLRERRSSIAQLDILSRLRRRLSGSGIRSEGLMPASGIGPVRAALGLWQLKHYPRLRAQRNRNAAYFQNVRGWHTWHVGPDISPAWLRGKLIPNESLDIHAISVELHKLGLRVGSFNWPQTLDHRLGRSERPHAHYAASFGLDVPVHQSMRPSQLCVIRNRLWT
jgi:dTDP-4-amino-4,6-dideoxygalactose transaminase